MLYYHKINGKNDIKKNEKLKANLAEIIETLIWQSENVWVLEYGFVSYYAAECIFS